jgi:hypothetical protein
LRPVIRGKSTQSLPRAPDSLQVPARSRAGGRHYPTSNHSDTAVHSVVP